MIVFLLENKIHSSNSQRNLLGAVFTTVVAISLKDKLEETSFDFETMVRENGETLSNAHLIDEVYGC